MPSIRRTSSCLLTRHRTSHKNRISGRAYPAREIAIAIQPGKIAYILLDQHLAELYSRWPHFISTAPEIAYAYVADYLRLRPDVTVKADSLGNLAQARHLPPQALTATVERFNRSVRGERSDAFGRTGDQVPLAGDRWILLGPVKAYFTTTEGGAAVNEQLQVLDAAGRPIDGLYAVGQNGLGGQILWGHGLHIAWALTSGRLVGQRLGSTADKGFPQALADVPDSPASWLDRGRRP